jgi:hypothetical protein
LLAPTRHEAEQSKTGEHQGVGSWLGNLSDGMWFVSGAAASAIDAKAVSHL